MSDEVRELSTRVIDPRAAAKGFVVVALLGALTLWGLTEGLWVGADRETESARTLVRLADTEPSLPTGASPRPIVFLLLDGLRVDEAERLPAMRAFVAGARHGTILYPRPTLSTGAYHALVTGAPSALSGVSTNRYHRNTSGAVARLDTLGDRVRALNGRERYLAEELDWLLQLVTPQGEQRELFVGPTFDVAFEQALEAFSAGTGAGLLVAHLLAVDESAHGGGIEGAPHRLALERADRLVAALHTAQRQHPELVALVVSDHGHLARGGHGGPEPEVSHAPFALRAEGFPPGQHAELAPECIPRLLSLASGLPTPRSSTCVTLDAPPPARTLERAAYAGDVARRERALHEARTIGTLGLAMLLTLMGLGATKRSFTGLDAGSLLAPLLWLAGAALGHALVLRKPFSLSALDVATSHLVSVGLLAMLSAALGLFLGVRVASRPGPRATPRRMALRRAAGALTWASIAAFALAWARIGGSYSPWPLSAFASYAPVFLASAGIGALIVASLAMLATVAKRDDLS